MPRDHELENRRRVGAGPLSAGPVPTPGKRTLVEMLGAGVALPPHLRAKFEQSLGRNLSGVRVHTDAAAAAAADSVNARAFAVGEDVVFAHGEYDPDRPESQQLLAHEVAHAAQQRDAAPDAAPDAANELATTQPGDAAERDADAAARAMIAGRPAQLSPQPIAIARKTRDESRESFEEAREPSTPEAPAAVEAAKPDGDAEPGELEVSRVGVEDDAGPDYPIGAEQNTEAGKQEIAAQGQALPQPDGAESIAPEPAGAAPLDVGEVSPEIAASIGAAQDETREAVAQAEAESTAFTAEMSQRRDQFDAEQHAMTLEQLKSMSPADKRSTLKDMGYDDKAVKKMSDAELDRIITGKIEKQQRQTRIMGMTPDELAKLSPERKVQHLVDLGIDKGDLDKIGSARAAKAFDDVMAVAHVQGQHTVKIKVKGGLLAKSWVVSVNCDAEGNSDIQAKKEGGFLSKLWGWVKAALPIILLVLAPVTAGATLIVLAVYQAAVAIQSGDWLGAIVAGAGALVGVGAFMAAKGALGAASAMAKVASVAAKVKTVAQAAQTAMAAAKAKNAGSLLGALASGAAAFAQFSANSADKLAQTMTRWSERLKKWSGVVSGGETVARGIKSGDPIAAIGGAFSTVSAAVEPDGKTAKNMQRASTLTAYAGAGRRALESKPPNYGAVAEVALGLAGTLKDDRRLEDATRLVGAANRLRTAWDNRETNPGGLAQAAFDVASAVQIAKYDATHEEGKPADGVPVADDDRTVYIQRYERAGRIVSAAGQAVAAASAKPRPNYLAALAAGNALIAELSSNRRLDQTLALTVTLGAWTAAVNAGDEAAIQAAGMAFGQAINGMRATILEDRARARADAAAKLPDGGTLADDGAGDDFPTFAADADGQNQPQAADRTWSVEAMSTQDTTLDKVTGPTPQKGFQFVGITADADQWIATFTDGTTIPIVSPKAPTPGYHNHTVREVAKAFAYLPKSARLPITRIQLNPVTNPQDAHWAVEYSNPNMHSYMSAGVAGVVTIYPDKVVTQLGDNTAQSNALTHETGHTWSYKTWGEDTNRGKWLDWKKAMVADGAAVSGYANSSIVEDVAETIRVYVSTKGGPRFAVYAKKVPNRFAMLEKEYK